MVRRPRQPHRRGAGLTVADTRSPDTPSRDAAAEPPALNCFPVPQSRTKRRGGVVGAGRCSTHVRRFRSPRRPGVTRLAAACAGQIPDGGAPRFSRGGHPGRRQDDVRAAHRQRAAGRAHRRSRHDRGAYRAPQDPVGAGRRSPRHRPGPEVLQLQLADILRVPRGRRHLRPGSQPPDPAPGAHREPQDAGRLRRDPPRR